MTTEEIIIRIFCAVDDELGQVRKVAQAKLYPSEVVTIGLLFARHEWTLSGVLSMVEARLRRFVWWVAGPHDGWAQPA